MKNEEICPALKLKPRLSRNAKTGNWICKGPNSEGHTSWVFGKCWRDAFVSWEIAHGSMSTTEGYRKAMGLPPLAEKVLRPNAEGDPVMRIHADGKIAVVFNEDEERSKFENHLVAKNIEFHRYSEYAGDDAGCYAYQIEAMWQGWLACARQKAEEGK